MKSRLDWDIDGRDWPQREASRFVSAGGLRWHVQMLDHQGAAETSTVVLVHGTGASTHSWRSLAPLLARHARVVAMDLPGHAFTEMPAAREAMSLPGMARALGVLLLELGVRPELVAGHSAGAAILARMCLDRSIAPRALVSLNGALLPLRGLHGPLFSPIAKLLAMSPIVPRLFAWGASDRAVVERLLRGTGSRIEPEGIELYARLTACEAHAAAALAMMANWDLIPLERDLPRLSVPVELVAAGNDTTISPEDALRVRDLVAGAHVTYLRGLGHLAHEENASEIAPILLRHLSSGCEPCRAGGLMKPPSSNRSPPDADPRGQ